ncbi:MAG TPA: hypothetical protein DDX93_05090 [Smithella sp.]|jgi:hypothetical protein|nr:hypothetical protein [Smithella sp.]
MNDEIQKNVKELQHAIIVAGLNYEIWWTYKEKESRKRYVDILNKYPLFFQTSLHAHFVAMIVSLYRLYETRKDTVNLPQLLKILKSQDSIPNQELKKIESEIKKIKPLWVKVSVLRNKMFGHRSNALNDDGIWKEAKVTPNQFKQLIDESKRILNEITSLWNRSSHAFNLSSTKDTVNLLEDLKQLNESQI